MTFVPDYYTFTARVVRKGGTVKGTEFAKRARALVEGTVLPTYTTQAFVLWPPREGELLSIGIVDTRELYRALIAAWERGEQKLRWANNALFQYIDWTEPERVDWYSTRAGWHPARWYERRPLMNGWRYDPNSHSWGARRQEEAA